MGLKKTLVYFKVDWVEGGYKGGEPAVMLLDTNIPHSQLVAKLYSKLKIEDSWELTIHSLATSSTRDRYQIGDDDDLRFAMEDQTEHMYLFVDTVAKDSGPSVQVNGSTPDVDCSLAITDIVIPTAETEDAYVNFTDANAHDFMEEHNGEGSDGVPSEHDDDDIGDMEDCPDVRVENDDEPNLSNRSDEPTWELPGASSYSFNHEVIHALSAPVRINPLEKGEIFRKKSDMKLAIGKYALENKFTSKVVRSNSIRFEVECSDQTCSFAFRARRGKGTSLWHVTEFTSEHSCVPDTHSSYYRPVKSDLIGNLYSSRVTVVDYRPKQVTNEMEDRYQVNIDYNKAWRSLQHALRYAYGDAVESYRLLPEYLAQLESSNPGTVTSLQTRSDNTFLYSFWSLGASIAGFLSYVRPVIAVDATRRKGEYKGVIMTAIAQDGNSGIYPVAFGFADGEDNNSWRWFLMMLKRAIETPADLVLVSDRHKSIFNAARHVYPDVPHVICYYHLANNLKSYGSKRGNVGRLLHAAAYAHSKEECDALIDDIKKVSPKMYDELRKIGKHRWTRAHCHKRRYAMLTSNIAESTNAAIKKARRLPITAANEALRIAVQRYFSERREAAQQLTTTVTQGAIKHINDLDPAVGRSMARPILEGRRYQVTNGDDVYVVDFETHSCGCRAWDLDRLPCLHAIAAARLMKVHPHTLCHQFYSKEWWGASYNIPVNPTAAMRTWPQPSKVVLPPVEKRQSGRPKMQRIPSRGERVRRKTCPRCGEKGHTRLRCPNPIRRTGGTNSTSCQDAPDGRPGGTDSTSCQDAPDGRPGGSGTDAADAPPARKRRRPVHCGVCHEIGHTVRKCPNKDIEVSDSEEASQNEDLTQAANHTDDSSSEDILFDPEAISSESSLL